MRTSINWGYPDSHDLKLSNRPVRTRHPEYQQFSVAEMLEQDDRLRRQVIEIKERIFGSGIGALR